MDIKAHIKAASVEELMDLRDSIDREMKARKESPKKSGHVVTYTDGASRGNPGHAGIGVLIFDDRDNKITQDFRYVGICTNNEAEYRALILALDLAKDITQGRVECVMDSELLVKQLNGQYAIKSEKLAQFYAEVKRRMNDFSTVTFRHVRREHPKLRLADQLANRGIDEGKPK